MILPQGVPAGDILNTFTSIRRWLVAACDPVLVLQWPPRVSLMAGQAPRAL